MLGLSREVDGEPDLVHGEPTRTTGITRISQTRCLDSRPDRHYHPECRLSHQCHVRGGRTA